MKKKLPVNLQRFRVDLPGYQRVPDDSIEGAFLIPYLDFELQVMCGYGEGWDHVSVSVKGRCPTWEEMNWVRGLFFEADETVIQIHAPRNKYINFHKHTLHMWRHWEQVINLPPAKFIAPIAEQAPGSQN